MSEKIISISPYAKADNIVDLGGFIAIDGIEERISIPEKKHLILFNYSLGNHEVLVPRNHDRLNIHLTPTVSKRYSQVDFEHLLLKGESVEKALMLRLQVWCKNTRWCSNQIVIGLNDIKHRKEVSFSVPISEIKDEIVISGFLTRETSSKTDELRKASSIYSVLSNCEDISIQIDERKDIGGNHLPIDPEDIGTLLFDIHGLDNDFDLPRIKYAREFEQFFKKDDLKSVNASFMMAMFYFLDSYLKWLIFKCKYDDHDKNHRGLIDLFSKYCMVSKSHLIELLEGQKFSEKQTKEYLSLSHKLFHGIQNDSSVKYAKELKLMIKDELK